MQINDHILVFITDHCYQYSCRLSNVVLLQTTRKDAALYYSPIWQNVTSSVLTLYFFLSQFLQEMMLFFARSLTRVPPLQSQTCVVENRPHNQRHSNFKVEVITNNKIFIALSYSIRKLKQLRDFFCYRPIIK